MELDDLKSTWGEMNRRLETSLAMSRGALREVRLDRTRSALRWLSAGLWYELLSGAAIAWLLVYFLSRDFSEVRYAIPAAGLLAFVVWAMAIAIRQLAAIGSLDFGGPVVAIQRSLAGIRMLRVWSFRWILILSPLLWTPLVIVVSRCLGFDIYRGYGPTWLAWNVAFGVAFILVAAWVSHRFGPWLRRSPVVTTVADSLAGRSIARAESVIAEIAQFEME